MAGWALVCWWCAGGVQIRFHILAMHELCEYPKGEGFAEGFDAHLNIEQMNKTYSDLFKMYDDHRRAGQPVASEAEFRGYYALLKVDVLPGFNVQPAELARDLARMPAQLRRCSEVLFARRVARACRTSNFVEFFRLADQATYLQVRCCAAPSSWPRDPQVLSVHQLPTLLTVGPYSLTVGPGIPEPVLSRPPNQEILYLFTE